MAEGNLELVKHCAVAGVKLTRGAARAFWKERKDAGEPVKWVKWGRCAFFDIRLFYFIQERSQGRKGRQQNDSIAVTG